MKAGWWKIRFDMMPDNIEFCFENLKGWYLRDMSRIIQRRRSKSQRIAIKRKIIRGRLPLRTNSTVKVRRSYELL